MCVGVCVHEGTYVYVCVWVNACVCEYVCVREYYLQSRECLFSRYLCIYVHNNLHAEAVSHASLFTCLRNTTE